MSDRNPHFNARGEFQSDKYPTALADTVPLALHDRMAQDLLYIYAQRRKSKDFAFSVAVMERLLDFGYKPDVDPSTIFSDQAEFRQIREMLIKAGWKPPS